VLAAYVNAAHLTDTSEPACKVSWQMLAGIGLIESDNARSGGSANPDWDGVADPPIYGPLLDGSNGTARVSGTGYGAYDGDSAWERAVGPMQILPSTWAVYAADGNHDGIRNPQDIDDATLAASDYLCASSRGLNQPKHLIRALYSYNHSFTYVRSVLTAIAGYLSIDPAKLGINGLPKRPRLVPMQIELPGPPAASSPSPPSPPPSGSPTPSPSPSWTPPPTPTPSPTLPVLPHR
jgi:membrane-bound lytic murein transglycosylase B